jgi:general secretion pathway protein G
MIRIRKRQAGFTLIEIMVVVIIIGLLSAMIAPAVFENQAKAFRVKAGNDISQIGGQLDMYRLDIFTYPSTAEGLQALVTNPGKSNWTGYGKKMNKDPWGNLYQYQYPGSRNSGGYDLWSFGADGVAGGEGANKDIGNWEDAN